MNQKSYKVVFELFGRMEVTVWYNTLINALTAMTVLFSQRGINQTMNSSDFFLYEYDCAGNQSIVDNEETGQIGEPWNYFQHEPTSIMLEGHERDFLTVALFKEKTFAGMSKTELEDLCYTIYEDL